MTNKYKEQRPVWVILRHDEFGQTPELSITVKEVVFDEQVAAKEVERLNRLNSSNGCRYWRQLSRLYPAGTSAGTEVS